MPSGARRLAAWGVARSAHAYRTRCTCLFLPKRATICFTRAFFRDGSRLVGREEGAAFHFDRPLVLCRYVCVAARFLVLLAPRTAHVCQPRSAPAGVLDYIAPLTATCPAVLATWRATA
jgi:hypothetical protein